MVRLLFLQKQAQVDTRVSKFLASDERWLKMNPKSPASPAFVDNSITINLTPEQRVSRILELQNKGQAA